MKTIEQLLALSKNPYYKFTPAEEQELNNFLFKRRERASEKSAKKSSKKSDSNTRATVTDDDKTHGSDTLKFRNIVEKTIPSVEESGQ